MSEVNLARFVREARWSDLEEAWTESILSDPGPRAALEAIEAAARKKELARTIPLARQHAEVLASGGRAAEAAHLLGTTMLLGGSPGELGPALYSAAEAAWGSEDYWEAFVEISGLRANAPDLRGAWSAFKKLLSVTPGRVIYHAKGWGLGIVGDIDHTAREANVKFVSGRADHFPFQSAIDIFEFLEPDDLRCLVVTDPDELAKRLKNEPLEILRWIVARNGGKSTQAGIKLAMGTLRVEGTKFTAWWRRAKKAAEASEWFELSGPANRVQVRLLDVAVDPADSMRRQLKRAKSLGEALTRVRALVSGGSAAEEVVAAALETIDELAQDDAQPLPQRLGTWLLLREQRGETPALLVEALEAAAEAGASDDPSQRPDLWSLFHVVPGSREQERCIDLLPDVLGEEWINQAARHLHHAAPGMVRALVELLEQEKRSDELLAHYVNLLARPTRNPVLFVRLAERLENGEYEDKLPPRLRRVQCLFQLAVHLDRSAVGDAVLTRTRMRLSDVLTSGDEPLLARLLAGADMDQLRGFARMMEPGVERDIERTFTHVAIGISPDVFKGDEKPFWDFDGILTTRKGLAKQEEELRLLREVKIPENSEAIGKAASYGDLSENSEWEAAIEDQRNLTNRAMELESVIRDAEFLEDSPIPGDTVSPGAWVRYRDLDDQSEHRIELLGPWDVEREDQISYRSPFGQGMLGSRPGEEATLELPQGLKVVLILEVGPLDI